MATLVRFTRDERRVAQALLRGESASQTCARLGIDESRYKTHLQHIFRKAGSREHLELVSKLRRSIAGA